MKIQNLRQKKWYVTDSESKGVYSHKDETEFLASPLESSLCDYSDAYILVTWNITVTGGNANTKVAFKNCAPLKDCRTEINEPFVDKTEHINIEMPMYNLIEYSDNYSDTSGSLLKFKGDEIEGDVDLTVDNHIPNNSSSFKYKSSSITNRYCVKIVVPLKYFSNFWGSLEMPLINCKVELSLKWYGNCILSSAGTAATFSITDTKLYAPVVTFKIENKAKLSKVLSEEFKRSVYWNKYQAILKDHVANKNIRERLDALFLPMCVVIMLLMKIHVEDVFFQGLRYRS